MANRSDRNSAFPRSLKRMLALSPLSQDPVREREIRKLFMDAHQLEIEAVKERLKAKTNVDFGEDVADTVSLESTT